MSTPKASTGRSRTIWKVVVALGVAAILLGLWDLLIERDGGGSWTPLALGACVIVLGVRELRKS